MITGSSHLSSNLRYIQFPANELECKILAEACQPATFGLEDKDVLDESYRKARKMDRAHFSIALEGAPGVSLEKAAKQLLVPIDPDDSMKREVEYELYKLNVYGKSFSLRLCD